MYSYKHLFIPNLESKSRSHLLQHPSLIGFVVVLLATIVINQVFILRSPNVLGFAKNIDVPNLLLGTNQIREKSGLSALTLNDDLSRAAYMKAQDMFADNYWAHTAPDGKEPWDFILASGYDYLYAGENLAVDFSGSSDVVDAWYDSPSHRANLLSDKYTEIGFAVVNGELEGRKTTLVVQMFGYPRSSSPLVSSDSAERDFVVKSEAEIEAEPKLEPELAIETEIKQEKSDQLVPGKVLNSAVVFDASKYIAIILGLFLTLLFALDGYYAKIVNINRVSGHTLLHILMLILVIAGIWYTNIGLVL